MFFKPGPSRALRRSSVLLALAVLGVLLPTALRAEDASGYVADAKRQFADGNFRAAEIQLRNALRADPDDGGSHLLLAQVYLKLRNPAAELEARAAQKRGVADADVAPVLAEALLGEGKYGVLLDQVREGDRPAASEGAVRLARGLAHLALNEVDKAEAPLRDAERLAPQDFAAKAGLARLFLMKGDLATAQKEVDEAAALAPRQPEVIVIEAELQRRQGDEDGALKRLADGVVQNPQSTQLQIAQADILVARNDLDGAEKMLQPILSATPDQFQANYLHALVLTKRGDYKQADAVLQKLSGTIETLPSGLFLTALVKFELRQYQQAEANAAKLVARDTGNMPARLLLAQIALAKGDAAQAIARIKPVIDADPSNVLALSILGQAYAASGRIDEALAAYRRAAELQPKNAALQTRVAVTTVGAGQVDDGLAALQQIMQAEGGAGVAGPVLVLAALRTGNTAKAAEAAEALLAANPKDLLAQNLLALVRIAQKDYAGAERQMTDIIKANGKLVGARRNLAELYLLMNRVDDARKIYQQIVSDNPADERALMGLAGIAVQDKDFAAAADLLGRAQAAVPADPAPSVKLMEVYAGQSQWQQALALGRDLTSRFRNDVAVLDEMGKVQLASGDVAAAVVTNRRMTEIAPRSAAAFQSLADMQMRAKDLAGARASLSRAIALAPGDERARTDLVDVDDQAGGPDKAVATAKSFSQDNPELAALLAANVLARAGRVDEARTVLAQAQQLHPAARLVIRLADLEHQQGHGEKSAALLTGWLAQHSDDLPVQLALANLQMADHHDDVAIAAYEAIRRQAPENVVALNNLAWLYQKKGDPKARTMAEAAAKLAPDQPSIADTLGWILLSNGEAGSGLPYLKRAGAGLPRNLDVQYHLAVALKATGETAQARTLLEQIVHSSEQFENRREAERLLAQLPRG